MKIQEVIDKLEEYKEVAGNKDVYVRDSLGYFEIEAIGWDPFKKKYVILVWE